MQLQSNNEKIKINRLSFVFIPEHIEKIGEEQGEDICISLSDQIEILIDENNPFGKRFGMFPLDFFSQDNHFFEGELQVGICGCSCYQCGDTFVNVSSNDDLIIWSYKDDIKYVFDKNKYTREINVFTKSYVPEELYLKVNTVILKELSNTITKEGYSYNMFRFYEYGYSIIIYFQKGTMEQKYYIYWRYDISILLEKIRVIKKEIING
jgi:hypothetical protein